MAIKFIRYRHYKNYVDTGGIVSVKTRVPDIENYEVFPWIDGWTDGPPGEFEEYRSSDREGKYAPANPLAGWYFKTIERRQIIDMRPLNAANYLCQYNITIDYRDRFRYIKDNISDTLIDFSEYWMTHNFSFTEQRTTTPEGYPARVIKHECKAKYLGKDFYWAVIDTIYQTTPLTAAQKIAQKNRPKVLRKIPSNSSQRFSPINTRQQTMPLTRRKRR